MKCSFKENESTPCVLIVAAFTLSVTLWCSCYGHNEDVIPTSASSWL